MKILIIDDDYYSAKSVQGFLKPLEYETDVYQNPVQALEIFKAKKHDIVITDYKMPELTGIDVLKQIKYISPESFVILFTGYADVDSAIQAVNYGADAFFRKPVEVSRFLETIDKIKLNIDKKNLETPRETPEERLKKYSEGLNILYVEDEEMLRQLFDETFSSYFKKIDYAENGEEGLRLYKENEYSIVVSDIKMPVMNGIEMIEEIKKIKPRQPIVVTSGYADTEKLVKLIQLGLTNFIMKPVNVKTFINIMIKVAMNIINEAELEHYKTSLENMVRDKTADLKRTNEWLQRTMNLYKAVLDDHSEMVVRLDPTLDIQFVNKTYASFIGKSKKDLVGTKFPVLMTTNNDRVEKLLHYLSFDNPVVSFDVEIESPLYKEKRVVNWVCRAVFDSDRDFFCYQVVGKDVTSEPKKQNESNREDASRFTEMLAIMAHQWRQPLSTLKAISSFMEFQLSLDEPDKDKMNENLTKLTRLVDYMSSTVNDFRYIYSPDKVKEPDKLGHLVETAVGIVRKSEECEDINFSVNNIDDPQVSVYSREMVIAFINIIKNAVDALSREKLLNNANIEVIVEKVDTFSQVRISNNGPHIPDDMLDNIFKPYFSTKSTKKGTGLGLYISKKMVEEHHDGKICVNNIDTGVEFCIRIPVLKS